MNRGNPDVWQGAAGHVGRGGTLYVQSHNTHLQKNTSPTAETLAVLNVGDAVTWNGPDSSDPRWQRVTCGYRLGFKSGVVFGTNLSVTKPTGELIPKPSWKCGTCGGSGYLPAPMLYGSIHTMCPVCKGSGLEPVNPQAWEGGGGATKA